MPPSSPDFAALATEQRVHRSVYTDPAVFAAEQERIFRRAWLYVGHESQVREAGDWLLTRLGPDEMVLIRGEGARSRFSTTAVRIRAPGW